ncbi:PRKR-interacting protein 1 homolog [Dysidea avara]|uniref:PRKR-interacting protein 1 homolog n=1 Tax=Dysidea avara TaxID=196820 RepID=UPI0033265BF5
MSDEEPDLVEDAVSKKELIIARNATDVQKMRLDKLMENPEKPVPIPDRTEDWKPQEPPDFVRFYMGSSAGAGSEVFHVYRHLRRRENARQDWLRRQTVKEEKDKEFQERMESNKAKCEEKTTKKREKRKKKKQRQLARKKAKNDGGDAEPQKSQTATADEDNSSENDENDIEQQQKDEDDQDEPPSFVMGGH